MILLLASILIAFAPGVLHTFLLTGSDRCLNDHDVSSFLHAIHASSASSDDRKSLSIVPDPYHSSCDVLKVHYDQGSYSGTHEKNWGADFYIKPSGYPSGADDVTMSYDVYFDHDFAWGLGGKLPGCWAHHTSCSGGNDANHCLSTRYMWRENGKGVLYLYFPKSAQEHGFTSWSHTQHASFTKRGDYGVDVEVPEFQFRKRHWFTLKQRIHLNSVKSSGHGNPDGWLTVWVDGNQMFNLTNMVLRKYSDVHIEGIFFSTFFGGHNKSWASPHDTYTLYRNFEINVN